MLLNKLWIAGLRICPVCKQRGAYNSQDSDAPLGWIHLQAFGVDSYLCSTDCVTAIRRKYEKRKKMLDESRKEPLLPPDVVI